MFSSHSPEIVGGAPVGLKPGMSEHLHFLRLGLVASQKMRITTVVGEYQKQKFGGVKKKKCFTAVYLLDSYFPFHKKTSVRPFRHVILYLEAHFSVSYFQFTLGSAAK